MGNYADRHTLASDVAKIIETARKDKWLSYRAAARRCGVSPTHLHDLCHGRRAPSVPVARAVVEGLGLTGAEASVVLAAAVSGRVGRAWRTPNMANAWRTTKGATWTSTT